MNDRMMDDLELPKTKLALSGGSLRRLGENGKSMATFELKEVKDIRCEKTADYSFPLAVIVTFSALAIVAKIYVSSPGLAWTGTIICSAIALFGFAMIKGRNVVVETENGTVKYPVHDGFEEAEGFVLSVKQRLKIDKLYGRA